MDRTVSSCSIRGGASVLALNSEDNRLIAAGQKSFQLFAIERIDNIEQFIEVHDFRKTPGQSAISRWCVLQPKHVAWSPQDKNCFASTSGTSGYLYTWDATRYNITNQVNIHSVIINRILFHPEYPNVVLTASQDGSAKLVDFRINDTDKVVTTFRHSSKEGFRDIDINLSDTNKFASVINDLYSVPVWDIRQPYQPEFLVLTRDKVLSVAWNPHEPSWLATGGIGGHDRTIRVWDTKGSETRQKCLFAVYTCGQVTKLSWRPTERYHIACFTRTTDPRIHVWDVRRAYLPQISFCHHRNEIEDFLWRSNSDNIISVGRDERLIHAPISSAIKSEQFVSLLSLNVTSKGSVHTFVPNLDNDYVRALYQHRHIPLSSTSLNRFYSYETMKNFSQWKKMIRGESVPQNFADLLCDHSIEVFHRFARKWIFGNGDKSLLALAEICDVNSSVAEQLHRPDLQATWQMVKMLFAKHHSSISSSKNSRSFTKSYRMSDSLNSRRLRQGGKLTNEEKQQQEGRSIEESNEEKRHKSQEQRILSSSKLDMIDEMNSYIVRDVLPDDLIFVTPNDVLNDDDEVSYEDYFDIEILQDPVSIPLGTADGDEGFARQFTEIMFIEDDEQLESEDEFGMDDMQTSLHSVIPDGSDNLFTVDESYCPTVQHNPLNFDDVIRQTLWYYVENNEIQVTVHLLLTLYPQMGERKWLRLFNGAHLQWLVIYIELLQKMRLFVKAKQVTKHCLEKENIPLNYNSADYDGTMILAAQVPTVKCLPSTTSSTNNSVQAVVKEFVCTICRIPCRTLFSFCGVCFHGGHVHHIESWFKTHEECPYGCGHRCTDRDSQNLRNGMSQHFLSKSSLVLQ